MAQGLLAHNIRELSKFFIEKFAIEEVSNAEWNFRKLINLYDIPKWFLFVFQMQNLSRNLRENLTLTWEYLGKNFCQANKSSCGLVIFHSFFYEVT